jgi:hypothetical protein
MTLGGFLGPSIAGFLYDNFAFRGATVSIVILDIFLVSLAYSIPNTSSYTYFAFSVRPSVCLFALNFLLEKATKL